MLRNLIIEELNRFIQNEVRYIDTDSTNKKNWKDAYNHEPIKNNETLRVFHGFDNLSDALILAKYGTSGKEVHARKYSYESGMNPSGIFVTTDFKIASDKFSYGTVANVVMEFSVRVSDLDTPVWNNSGSYFGQGSNPQPFRGKAEREAQKQSYNDDAAKSDETRVNQSDNKALANMIFNNPEHQALYYGDLNPNMIKRFWVKSKETNKRWVKLTREEFLQKFGDYNMEEYVERQHDYPENKMYKPNDDFKGLEDIAYKIAVEMSNDKNNVTQDEINDNLKNIEMLFNGDNPDYHTMKTIMYPKQIIQMKGEDWYRENVNKFY